MDKIILKHSRIEINNYEMGDCPRLEYLFSVWNPTYHQSFFKAIEYDEANKKLIVPRGMDISFLTNAFACEATVDRKHDEYVSTDPFTIKYLPKDKRQLDILKFILGMDNYYYTKTKSQLACNSTTGSGKTFVTIGAICYTGSRAIIITSSIEWLNQWKARIMEYTQLSEKQIYMMVGSSSIHKLLNRDPLQYQIILASHATIKSYGDKYGWQAVDDLFKYIKCVIKVFDEAHLYFDNMCKIDYHSNTKKTLYLTATPARSSKEENQIYQMYFKNIPSIVLFDEETDPHVKYVAMHFNSHPTVLDINRCKNQYGFDRNKYTSYVVDRPNFLNLVLILIDMVINMNGKILIYIGTNSSITKVYKYILEHFPFLKDSIGIYTSAVDKDQKEYNLYKKIILSTTKSCGAASDIYDLRCVINLAEPFKSEVLSRQTLGRCRMDNTLYIDIVDQGFYFTKKYYEAKKPVFSMYSKSCSDIYLSDEELSSRAANVLNKYSNNNVMCTVVYNK